MSGPVNIDSEAEWQSLLSSTSVVIADFYADWCGPCKMIAPHFERLAKEHSSPKKVAFAKVNVDNQSSIARSQGVAAMPTFKIFHGGNCIETIKGANPSALGEAISKAVKLAGTPGSGKSGNAFKSPGRTLGSDAPVGGGVTGGINLGKLFNILIMFVGLYLVSLFSIDAYKAAENSRFNAYKQQESSRVGGGRTSSSGTPGGRPAQNSKFRTLADLGKEE